MCVGSLIIDQRESELGVNFRGNFRDQLFLVNFMVLNTILGGDRAREGAFSLKPPKTAEKPPNLYIKNGWSYELRLTFILSRKITFLSNLSVSKAIDQHKTQKTPKTAENRQNRRIHT